MQERSGFVPARLGDKGTGLHRSIVGRKSVLFGHGGDLSQGAYRHRLPRAQLKLSRYNGQAIDGYECVYELVASRLMEILGVEHAAYRLVHARVMIDGVEHVTWVNTSRSFRRPGERKLAFGAFFELYRGEGGDSVRVLPALWVGRGCPPHDARRLSCGKS